MRHAGRHLAHGDQPAGGLRAFVCLDGPLGLSPKTLATKIQASSFSDLEQFCEDIQRRYVLSLPDANLKRIVTERLKQWQARFTISQ